MNGFNYYIVRYHIYVPNELCTEVGEKQFDNKDKAIACVKEYLNNRISSAQGYTFDKKCCKVILYKMFHKDETYFSDDKVIETKIFD